MSKIPVGLIRHSLLLLREEVHTQRGQELIDAIVGSLDPPPPSRAALRKRAQRERDKQRDGHADSHGDSHAGQSRDCPPPSALPSFNTSATAIQNQDQEGTADPKSSSSSENAGARAKSTIHSEDVAREWHTHAQHHMLLHAHSSKRWRTAYETIATAVNAFASNHNRVARETLVQLMRWWWRGSDGPVGGGRVRAPLATPELIADRVSIDLMRAMGFDPKPTNGGPVVSPKKQELLAARAAYEAAQRSGDKAEELRLEKLLEKLGREYASG